jgi:hypothetical protein
MNIFKQLFNSKKFYAALTAALIIIFSDGLGLTEDQATNIVNTIMAYLIGQGIADNGKEAAKTHTWKRE